MPMLKKYKIILFSALLIFSAILSTSQAEEGTVKIYSPWKAKGQVYKVGLKQFQFVGEFGGIMYVEKGDNTLDTAIFVCPAVQDMDYEKNTTRATGKCHIVTANGNIFASFVCTGVPGACNGDFTLTGGTERFKEITGSGEMRVRSALRSFITDDVASGDVIAEAEGIAIWPALKYRIPN